MGIRLDSVLVVDYRRSFDTVPDEVMALLPLFDGQRTARDALRRGRVPDAHAAALVDRLRRLGIVTEPEAVVYPDGPDLDQWLAAPPRQNRLLPARNRLLWLGGGLAAALAVSVVALVWPDSSHSLPATSAVAAAPAPAAPAPVVAAPAPVVAPPVVAAPAPVVAPPVVVAAPAPDVAAPPPPVVAAPVVAPPQPENDYPKLIRSARSLLDKGAYAKALDAANHASAARPGEAEPFLIIGTVEQEKGRIAQAETAYKRYLALAPKGAYAGEIRAILRTLH